MRRSFLAVPIAVALLLAVACGSNKLVGPGGDCFLATDCADGLVCVPVDPAQPTGKRTCTNDVSGIATNPDAGADTAIVADAPGADTGPIPDTGAKLDTSVPDTSVGADTSPPPPDSSVD